MASTWFRHHVALDYETDGYADEAWLRSFIEAAGDEAMCRGLSMNEIEMAVSDTSLLLYEALGEYNSIPRELKRAAIAATVPFFQRLASTVSEYMHPVGYFWDTLSVSDDLLPDMFAAIEKQMEIDNQVYQDSALMGLDLFAHRPGRALLRSLMEREDIAPAIRARARYVLNGETYGA